MAREHEYQVRVIGKDARASTIDDAIVRGVEARNAAIKAFKQKHNGDIGHITVWDESAQRPAKGWNDDYR